jgi:hypothetical protein
MPIFLVPISESNDCHTPAGSPAGGEFCSTGGKILSADDVGALLEQQHEHVEARKQEQEFGAVANTTRHEQDYLQDKFVVSKTFQLMEIDVESAAPIGVVRSGALAHSRGPIVVDKNKGSFGRGMYGAPPLVVVLDGKHRLAEAKARGEKTIVAYVGEAALPHVKPVKRESLGARNKRRAAGMSRMKIASGGASAEKERKRLHRLTRGRDTQRLIRAIRARED